MEDFNAPAFNCESSVSTSASHESDATTISINNSTSTTDTTDHNGESFFATRAYRSKEDVIAAVVEYNHVARRAYRVVTSDKRRYQAKCATDGDQCAFVVRFAFSTKFKPPTRFHPHTCSIANSSYGNSSSSSSSGGASVTASGPSSYSSMLLSADVGATTVSGHDGLDGHTGRSVYGAAERATNVTMVAIANGASTNSTGLGADQGAAAVNTNSSASASASTTSLITNRACRAKQITRYPEVRALVVAHGASVKAAWIKDVLIGYGLQPTYANCFHARKRLLTEFAADPVKFAENNSLVSLATFASASGEAYVPSVAPATSTSGDVAGAALSGDGRKRAAPVITDHPAGVIPAAPATSAPSKKPKHDLAPVAAPPIHQPTTSQMTTTPTPPAEPQGCCFICPSVRVANSSTAAVVEKHQILQWQVRDQTSVKTFFDLYDDNRRIEILKSGTFRLHLYFESQSGSDAGTGGDNAKYYLMVNNKPVSVFKDESSNDTQIEENGQYIIPQARDDVPLGVFNVAQVQLKKWDMIVLRRTRGEFSSSGEVVAMENEGNVQTPFGRFIIELVE